MSGNIAAVTNFLDISTCRMLHSTGKETKGRGGRGDLRRSIVISFLAGCQEEELEILLDLVTDPFTPILNRDYASTLDLSKALPPKRILGILSTVVVIMDKLCHLLTSHLSRVFHLLVSVLRYCVCLLDGRRADINFKSVNSMKAARQTAIKCLTQFMETNSDFSYSETQITELFEVAVWPQLPRLTVEGASAPTPLLSLIKTWTHYRRYLPLLLKLTSATSADTPLAGVMKLLAAPLCKPTVGSLIMEMVENILDFNSSITGEPVTMEVDDRVTLPAGTLAAVDDSVGSYEVAMLTPYLFTIITYIKDRVSKAALKATNQKAFPMRELNILSVCSQYVEAPALCTALLTQLLPFLTGGTSRLSPEKQCGILQTLGNLAKKSDDIDGQLCKLLPLCSSLTQRIVRMELVKLFLSLRDLSAACKEVADFVEEVNAFDRSRIEEPDYDSRLGAFREIVWWDYGKCPLPLVLAMVHNCAYTLRHVSN
ncbi:small subunit processome component 20 homolog [Watersipora subatra]|uniref:small subunit processome component 20 homolog n=1 Tax=Watersipora subatra TaxID=2589382 RepID=UPI00355B309C